MMYYDCFVRDAHWNETHTIYKGFDKSAMEKEAKAYLAEFKKKIEYIEAVEKNSRKWDDLLFGEYTTVLCVMYRIPDGTSPDAIRDAIESTFGHCIFSYSRSNYKDIFEDNAFAIAEPLKVVDIYGKERIVDSSRKTLHSYCNRTREITYNAPLLDEDGEYLASWTEYRVRGRIDSVEERLKAWDNGVFYSCAKMLGIESGEEHANRERIINYIKENEQIFFTKNGDIKNKFRLFKLGRTS